MYDFFRTDGERMFGHKFDDSIVASRGNTTEHPSPDVGYDPTQLDLGHTLRGDVSHVT
jgi:hypothetical protein